MRIVRKTVGVPESFPLIIRPSKIYRTKKVPFLDETEDLVCPCQERPYLNLLSSLLKEA